MLRRLVSILAFVSLFAACRDAGAALAERAAAAKAAEAAADATAREATRAKLEAQRVAALWRYQQATVGGGAQVTAAIFATDDVDVDGQGPKRVQLVFRDHVKWGRRAYLAPGWRAGWMAVGATPRLDDALAAIKKLADGRLCSSSSATT